MLLALMDQSQRQNRVS